jgi:PST family polysaccharide transporter
MNASWTTYLPAILREWLDGRLVLQKTIGNTGWLLFDRVLRIVIGLTIGAWIARYLGPSQFGELAYVLSFIAFFQVIADLQADGFIVRDIAQERGEPSVVLGTALWLRLIFGIVAWICAAGLMLILHPEDQQLFWLVAIIGGTMVFRTSETVDLWFQSQSQSKRTVAAKLIVYLFSNGIKIALLLSKAPLVAFAGAMCLEGAATALGLAIAYRRFPTHDRWRATVSQAKTLLHLCWPFIACSFMVTVFLRIDQIMLKEMLGKKQLGIFAAALPISQALSVIPSALIVSLAPYVARKMNQNERLYEDALVTIFRTFAILSISGASLIALLSPWLIKLMYGTQYEFSAVILSVHVFVNVIIFQGIAQDLWIINKTVRREQLISTFVAAIIGVASNALLIRKFGTLGAVFSYILAQAASVVVIPCLLRPDLFDLYKRAFLGIAGDYDNRKAK